MVLRSVGLKNMRFKDGARLIKGTIAEWKEDNVPVLAAALAYYTVFSLAPLLLIAIAIAGAVFGEEAARGELVRQIQGLVGKDGAEAIQAMIQNADKPGSGGAIATIIGVVLLMFGASGVFGQLQAALNTIWEVKPKPGQGIRGFLVSRFLSFAMVLVIGFLLLVSLLLSTVLATVSYFFNNLMPGIPILGQVINFAISFGVITVLFASIYKFLPDVEIPWKNLWVGAAVTAILFNIGKLAIGLYLGNSSVGSAYGAAGSLVVLLIWVFYSAQILLIGAEFTQVYSKYRGTPLRPSKHAVPIDEKMSDRSKS
ncbi:YihY/virulence factor BrkB family protein [Leptolyngbya sp. Cla-17]|uniref:YihY/virulence factor BrkB family protein n=1 Tax=Leptolyngbya sp. Cla-17 TaxID=2803751 RepID=UPI0018D80118|nr:YihY/virulence factor BrkB family protein [Leptolyngbya sp. Cla-17]